MSRPKSVKYGSGEVLLKNLTEEEKATVTKLLQGPETEVVETEDGEFKIEPIRIAEPKAELTHVALSITKIGVMWNLVTINFNPETQDMEFTGLKPLHTNKNIALHRFAVEQMKVLGK